MPRRRRKRGSGGIVRRADGRWQAQWSGGLVGGKRQRKSATFNLRDDAEWWLRQAERQGAPPDAKLTVAEYLETWLASAALSVRPATANGYAIHVHRWIVPAIGGRPLVHFNGRDAENVRDYVAVAGRAPRTVQSVLVTLKIAMNAAVATGMLDRNLALGIRSPRRVWQPFETTDAAQAREIIAAFAEHPLEPIVIVALGTGLRLGEILALRWTDIKGDMIRVTGSVRPAPKPGGGRTLERIAPKTPRSIRAVRIPPYVVESLASLHRAQAETGLSEKVFPGRGDAWRDPTAVRQTFQRVLARNKLRRMRFHDLRHAYATIMLAADVPLRTISEQLGHTSIALTANIYAHVLPEARQQAIRALDEAIRAR